MIVDFIKKGDECLTHGRCDSKQKEGKEEKEERREKRKKKEFSYTADERGN